MDFEDFLREKFNVEKEDKKDGIFHHFEFDDYDDALPFAVTALNECTEECEITITFRKKED